MADTNIQLEVNRILGIFSNNVDEAVKKSTVKMGHVAVEMLKQTSPRSTSNREKYADDWYLNTTGGRKNHYKAVVANKQYRLTHLLEHGHNIVRNGKVVGHAGAKPHIKDVERWVQDNYEGYIQAFLDFQK